MQTEERRPYVKPQLIKRDGLARISGLISVITLLAPS